MFTSIYYIYNYTYIYIYDTWGGVVKGLSMSQYVSVCLSMSQYVSVCLSNL